MIDLGVEKDFIKSELEKLNLHGWQLIVEKDQRHGIMGTKVTVKQDPHEHSHRHLSDIEQIVYSSSLGVNTRDLSMKIFRKLADAEATVHGIPVEKVHFHEVGAVDSIIDIVGAAICFIALKPDAVHVSPVELGSGFVNCEHGKLPVPAPATTELMKGIPAIMGGVDFEATTPTGAATLASLGTDFLQPARVRIMQTGYGIGHKNHPDVPNLLRVSVGEYEGTGGSGHEAFLIECNIDDMNPEFYDYISDRLFKVGAADVYFSDIIMKKGRPGITLNVICEPGLVDIIKEVIFTESTTLGIRIFQFHKETLSREFRSMNTIYGEVTFKHAFLNGQEVSVKPEFEECRKIALEKGIPVKEVYNYLISLITKIK